MFTIEAALFRHLQERLPEMIRNVDEAALLDRLEHRSRSNAGRSTAGAQCVPADSTL
jgi:hypothetical protein